MFRLFIKMFVSKFTRVNFKMFKLSELLLTSYRCKLTFPNGSHQRHGFGTSTPATDTSYLTSPLGNIDIPNINIIDYVWKDTEKWNDHVALTCGLSGRGYTYRELQILSRRMFYVYTEVFQLKKGDIIGLILPNIPEFVPICHGALEAGILVTLTNPLYTPAEMRRQFEDCATKLIVCVAPLLSSALQVGITNSDFKGFLVVGAQEFDIETDEVLTFDFSTLVENAETPLRPPPPGAEEVAILPYSSGTTGVPKGVILTHKNVVANCAQMKHPLLLGYDPHSLDFQVHALTILPFFHIYGFTVLHIALSIGCHVITMPRFLPEYYIHTLVHFKPSILFVVPSLLTLLANHPSIKREHLECVNQVLSGAAPASSQMITQFLSKTGRSDILVRQGYGMTESAPVTILAPSDIPFSEHGSVGILLPNTEAKVINTETGVVCGPNVPGELLVRGPQIMVGYYKNEAATRNTIDDQGWLHTGDVAYYDEKQYFHIVDRTKELIKVKGYQVSPTELENLIKKISGVRDVAVVGIQHELTGEVPRAFIVCAADSDLDENMVRNIIDPLVAKHKRLEGGVKFVKEIPRNATGKIMRNVLRVLSDYGTSCKK